MNRILVEACCGSLRDALTAARFPCARVELNSALELGGCTPSPGEFLLVKKQVALPVMVMIRPRSAGFVYEEAEAETMFQDARWFLAHGADGIVFGFLRPDHTIDAERTARMVQLVHAHGRTAVFHKAFDAVPDAQEAMTSLLDLKVDRVLTSGHEKTALAGAEELHDLLRKYGTRIEILPGGGIRGENVRELLQKTGAGQIHLSARMEMNDQGTYPALSARKLQDLFAALKETGVSFHRPQDVPLPDIEMLQEDRLEADKEDQESRPTRR